MDTISQTEQAFLRNVFMPLASTLTTWSRARTLFIKEGESILELTSQIASADLNEKVQIPKMIGLDSSSTNWSVSMTLEHLMISSRQIADVLIDLSWGRKPDYRIDLNSSQPSGKEMKDARKVFRPFLGMISLKLDSQVDDWSSTLEHPHPWFGPLNARQWHCLMAWHQRLHRRQIQSILKHGLFGL